MLSWRSCLESVAVVLATSVTSFVALRLMMGRDPQHDDPEDGEESDDDTSSNSSHEVERDERRQDDPQASTTNSTRCSADPFLSALQTKLQITGAEGAGGSEPAIGRTSVSSPPSTMVSNQPSLSLTQRSSSADQSPNRSGELPLGEAEWNGVLRELLWRPASWQLVDEGFHTGLMCRSPQAEPCHSAKSSSQKKVDSLTCISSSISSSGSLLTPSSISRAAYRPIPLGELPTDTTLAPYLQQCFLLYLKEYCPGASQPLEQYMKSVEQTVPQSIQALLPSFGVSSEGWRFECNTTSTDGTSAAEGNELVCRYQEKDFQLLRQSEDGKSAKEAESRGGSPPLLRGKLLVVERVPGQVFLTVLLLIPTVAPSSDGPTQRRTDESEDALLMDEVAVQGCIEAIWEPLIDHFAVGASSSTSLAEGGKTTSDGARLGGQSSSQEKTFSPNEDTLLVALPASLLCFSLPFQHQWQVHEQVPCRAQTSKVDQRTPSMNGIRLTTETKVKNRTTSTSALHVDVVSVPKKTQLSSSQARRPTTIGRDPKVTENLLERLFRQAFEAYQVLWGAAEREQTSPNGATGWKCIDSPLAQSKREFTPKCAVGGYVFTPLQEGPEEVGADTELTPLVECIIVVPAVHAGQGSFTLVRITGPPDPLGTGFSKGTACPIRELLVLIQSSLQFAPYDAWPEHTVGKNPSALLEPAGISTPVRLYLRHTSAVAPELASHRVVLIPLLNCNQVQPSQAAGGTPPMYSPSSTPRAALIPFHQNMLHGVGLLTLTVLYSSAGEPNPLSMVYTSEITDGRSPIEYAEFIAEEAAEAAAVTENGDGEPREEEEDASIPNPPFIVLVLQSRNQEVFVLHRRRSPSQVGTTTTTTTTSAMPNPPTQHYIQHYYASNPSGMSSVSAGTAYTQCQDISVDGTSSNPQTVRLCSILDGIWNHWKGLAKRATSSPQGATRSESDPGRRVVSFVVDNLPRPSEHEFVSVLMQYNVDRCNDFPSLHDGRAGPNESRPRLPLLSLNRCPVAAKLL